MKVFISWAGEGSLSHEGAKLMQKWLEAVLPGLKCFVSSHNIGGGELWMPKLFAEIGESHAGICCLTRESGSRDWMLYSRAER